MSSLNTETIPEECSYCNNVPVHIVIKKGFLRKTSAFVCDECMKEIWEQETNRKLP